MIDPAAIAEILKTYEKHGWTLRRVLLSEPAGNPSAGIPGGLFGGVAVSNADIDALWFSRPSRPGTEAWELRALASSPLALLEVIPDSTDEAERKSIMRSTEERLRGMIVRGRARDN